MSDKLGNASSHTDLHDFVVMSNERVAQDIFCLRCHTDVAATLRAGQFVNIAVPGDGSHILRIPLSFSHADAANKLLEIYYAVVGEGTRRLSKMRADDTSTMVGPCGNGWSLPAREGRALLVAGGVGLPPIVAAARMLADAGYGFDAIVGAQTAPKHVEELIDVLRTLSMAEGCDCARKVMVTTDDGTLGMRGFTTQAMQDLLAENAYGRVYTCGPAPMMAGVAKLCASRNMDCEASLERMMGCGFGACSCCNVRLAAGGYALCCTDGPVFDAKEVAW